MDELFESYTIITKTNTEEYKIPGIWAMFGIENENNLDEKFTCLNVGKSKSVGNELAGDFKRIAGYEIETTKVYKNQFNQKKFEYDVLPGRLECLYKEISKNYSNITVILVARINEYKIEKYFAYSFKASYWVSNGRYFDETIVDDEQIENIRESVYNEVKNIEIKKILDEINTFKLKYENYLKK